MKKVYIILLAVLYCHAQALAQQPGAISAVTARLRAQVDRKSDTALLTADTLLELAKTYNAHDARLSGMSLKGKALYQQHKPKEALDIYFAALRECRSPEDDRRIAYLNGEVGYVLFSQQQLKESLHYYREELAIRRRISGRDSVGDQLINLAVMFQGQGLYDSAEVYLAQVAGILSRTKNVKLSGYYNFNMGALRERQGHQDTATAYYLKAYNDWKSVHHESQLFKVTFNLGFLEYEKKNYAQAVAYYKQSLDAARKFGMVSEIAHVYGTMAESYAELKDYKTAYTYLHDYATMSDSLSRADLNNYIARLDKQFQAGKARQTIQQQQLELQKQKSSMLLLALLAIVVVFAAVALFVYFNFKRRVQKKVDEAKEKFFANVAHEVRTPLSMIQGPIKLLQEQVTTPEAKYQLEMAERNAERLHHLINQMLDLSKVDADSYQLNASIGNAGDFIAGISRQYAQQAQARNISFTADIEETGTSAFDKDALEKIVTNLLGNALKYTPEGGSAGITVAAGISNLDITVWDTGCGIAPANQQKIFDRFYRASETATRTRGLGIGLSLTRELVGLMGGSIQVTSEPDKGAVFTVSIPWQPQQQWQANTANTGSTTILLVEDDADILDFNRTLLAANGYNIITATNGDEGLAMAQAQLPDLVISDVMMHGKSGTQLLAAIRAASTTNHIPVILLSAKASATARLEGLEAGAQAYLGKPYQPAELVALIKNQLAVLERQRTTFQAGVTDATLPVEERITATDPFVQRCTELVLQHLDDADLTVEKLAEMMNANRSHFQRKLKTITGYSPSELIRTIRLEKALELLQKKEGNITEVAYLTGFTSQSYFTRCFTEHFGYPPSHLNRKDETARA